MPTATCKQCAAEFTQDKGPWQKLCWACWWKNKNESDPFKEFFQEDEAQKEHARQQKARECADREAYRRAREEQERARRAKEEQKRKTWEKMYSGYDPNYNPFEDAFRSFHQYEQRSRSANGGANSSGSASGSASTPSEFEAMLPKLILLCHPDKHGNSKLATEVTQWLLKKRGKK